MKRIITFLLILILTALLIPARVNVAADSQTSAPYDTYTVGPNGKIIKTQTAYEPAGIINVGLSGPEDFYLKDDIIYIADTGNKRIVKYYLDGTSEVIIDNLSQPTGVHVDENDFIYVADKGARTVNKYTRDGELVQTFGRPTELIFGNSPYVPIKVTTGPKGIIYVVGEGSTAGLIQLSYNGEFQGFFATNATSMSFIQRVANFFNVSSTSNIPISPSNVAIDEKGSIYTVSNTADGKLKKFNVASETILKINNKDNFNSLHINEFNNIYALSNEGDVKEYDSYGNMIFSFGGLDTGTKRLGLFITPVDLTTDSSNNIYVLDKGLNQIQIFQKSEFAGLVHDGLRSFRDGIYDIEKWEEVLRMNTMFSVANSAIARAEFRNLNYNEALHYYKIAGDKSGYSEAYWQIRYDFLQQNMLYILIGIIAFIVLAFGIKVINKRTELFIAVHNFNDNVKNIRIVSELRLLFQMFKHPIDTYHDVKRYKKSSNKAASILYVVFVVVMIAKVYLEAFLFNNNNLETFSLFRELLIIIGLILLFVVSNYLISSLLSGEGFLKDIYRSTAYALAPMIVFTPFIILLSHGLTYNEIFIYNAAVYIMYIWTAINLIIMIKEIHNYTLKELIVNILLTFFMMIIIVVVLVLIYLLANQLYEYVISIIKEVINYVYI